MVPPPRPTFLLPWLLWHLSNLQWRCNAIASWMDSRFKIQDSYGLFPANLESRIQDSRFPETLLSKSWIQILNPTPGFKIQDSWGLFPANLESRIQDSRFPETLLSKSWIQILNPTPGFKIQDSWGLFPANLESRIQDSRFPGTLCRKSWIQDSRWIQDLLQRVPGNLESWILGLDSRFAPKSSWESWILNPGVGLKICSKEFLGILNLESWGWIQDLLQRVPGNLESWIQWLDSRFAPESSWESWILKFRPEK